MSEILLIVHEALANEHFENCTVVTQCNSWPKVLDEPIAAHPACPYVASTGSTNADSVRQMLKTLKDMPPSDRCLVFADHAIPQDLKTMFPAPLFPLLQRALPCDLVWLSAPAARLASNSGTMLMWALCEPAATAVINAPPCLERFPHAVPGKSDTSSGVSAAALTSAIDVALTSLKLSATARKCLTSGILLLWDFLHESHEISQTMEGRGTPRTGDYWHGIMHRREPDAGNASYWFRRVGRHPAFASLASNLDRWMAETGASDDERALALRKVTANGSLDPFGIIELSTEALRKPGQLEDCTLRRVQYLEILNLLTWSLTDL